MKCLAALIAAVLCTSAGCTVALWHSTITPTVAAPAPQSAALAPSAPATTTKVAADVLPDGTVKPRPGLTDAEKTELAAQVRASGRAMPAELLPFDKPAAVAPPTKSKNGK